MNKKLFILSLILISSASAVSMPNWREINRKLSSITIDDVRDTAKCTFEKGKNLAREYAPQVWAGAKEYFKKADAWIDAHPYKYWGSIACCYALIGASLWSKMQHRRACEQANARGYDWGYRTGYDAKKTILRYERYDRGNESEEN